MSKKFFKITKTKQKMKHLVFALLLLPFFTYAQNGGQVNENNSVKLTIVAKPTGYYANVYSKQNCYSNFNFDYNGNGQSFWLNYHGIKEIFLGTTLTGKVKVKNTSNCDCGDNGWVEIIFTVTPLKFTGNPAVTYDHLTDNITIKITVTDVYNVQHIKPRVSFDGGKTKKEIGLVFLDFANPNTTYIYKIKKADLLKLNTHD